MEKGLIVNIQDYSSYVTQELAIICEQMGTISIRTDQPIKLLSKTIGFCLVPEKKFKITTTKEVINQVNKWADYVSIDSRKGNLDLNYLYAWCHTNGIKMIAEIGTIKDFENIINFCERDKIEKPKAFSTLFASENIITQIKDIRPGAHVIAYCDNIPIKECIEAGADNIMLGNMIANIGFLTKNYINYYNEVVNGLDKTKREE